MVVFFMYQVCGTACVLQFYCMYLCNFTDILIYVLFVKLRLGCHPVAVVQYTFTHKHRTRQNKQYIEQHKNIYSYSLSFNII